MFSVIYHELDKLDKKMKTFELASKEAAAPLMSVTAPLWFWKFWKQIENFGIFFRNFESFENYEEFWKIMSYNFKSKKQILTLRGVYCVKVLHYLVQKWGLCK